MAIEKKREQMINIAETQGLSSVQVLKCSQELDQLIDLYHSQTQKKDKSPKKQRIMLRTKSVHLKGQLLKNA